MTPRSKKNTHSPPNGTNPDDRYLREAFENMREGFQVIGRDWRYLYINEVAAGHGEKRVEDLLGRHITEAYPGIDQTAMFKTLEKCMVEKSPATLESEFTYADGHSRWFELRISPLPDSLGILSLDITDRKRAEAKVQKLTRTLTVLSNINQSIVRVRDLHSLFEQACRIAVEDGQFALVWIGLLDETGERVRIAAQAGEAMNYLRQVEVPLEQMYAQCPIEKALRTGRHTICNQIPVGQGSLSACQQSAWEAGFRSSASFPLYVSHEIRGSLNLYSHDPDFFDEDEIKLIKEMSLDIGFAIEVAEGDAEHIRNEEAYRESQEQLRANELRLRLITDNMTDMIGLTNQDGIFEYISPSVKVVLGCEPAEFLGRSIFEGVHPEDRPRVMRLSMRALRSSQIGHAELRYRSASGRYVWLDSTGVPIYDAQGRVVGSVISSRDLTRRKLVEDTLRQRVKELETLRTVSSALRTTSSLEEALSRMLDESLSSLDTDAGEVMMYDPAAGELNSIATRGWLKQFSNLPIPPGQGIAGTVFNAGRPHVSTELARDELVSTSIRPWIPEGYGGVAVPIRAEQEVVGVLLASVRLPRRIGPEQIHMLEAVCEIGGAAIQRLRLHAETVRRLGDLQALHEVELAISSSFDLRPTLDTVVGHAIHQAGVDAADILLLRPNLQTLEFAAGRGFHTRLPMNASVRVGESFAGRAVLERRMVRVVSPAEAAKNPLFAELWKSEGFTSCYCLPLISKGEVKGALEVYSRGTHPPRPDGVYYLDMLAGQAAIAIDNSQLFENLQHANLELGVAYESTLEGWSRALDLRDQETEGHTLRVTEMTLELAKHFKFSMEEMQALRRGAILHDIGKMGVPDAILLKTSELTDEEREVMRKHPQFAYEMLKPIYYLRDSLDIPYGHHEKWDGSGYPRGLSGTSIPLSARIFAVVDVFDALTHDRPYRKAWPQERAFEYIHEQSGKYFDPQVVTIFLRKFGKHG